VWCAGMLVGRRGEVCSAGLLVGQRGKSVVCRIASRAREERWCGVQGMLVGQGGEEV